MAFGSLPNSTQAFKDTKLITQNGNAIQEDTQLLYSKDDITTYKRRWYILALFSFFAILQSVVWGTFSPIARSSMFALHWTTVNITLLIEWSNIAFVVTCVPLIWILSTRGLRVSMLIACSCVVVSAALHCITIDPVPATWLANISAIINGVAQVVVITAPSLLSVTWFPVNERATATALTSSVSYIGSALLFVIGPLLVTDAPTPANEETTQANNLSSTMRSSNNSWRDEESIRKDILRLMYIEGGCCALMLLLVIIYFHDKPPNPPSITASTHRTEYKQGIKTLLLNRRFMIIAVAYSLPTGVYLAWTAVLTVNLGAVGISQVVSGWIGFISVAASYPAGVLLSRLTDMWIHHLKSFLVMSFIIGTVMWTCFLLIRHQYVPFSAYLLYTTSILGSVFVTASIPLFYELSCEAAYPVGESVAVGVLAFLNQFWGILFLSFPLIPNIGLGWMNWSLLVSVIVPIPLLVMTDTNYTRSDIDTGHKTEDKTKFPDK